MRRLGIEYCLKGELTQSRLDVTRGSSAGTSQDVSPVSLSIDEQVFLSQLHEGIADGSIAMWVELHGVAYDIRHLVIAPVIHSFHRVKDASLHRLQTVFYMRHGTFQYDV